MKITIRQLVQSCSTPTEMQLYIDRFGLVKVNLAIAEVTDRSQKEWLTRLLQVLDGSLPAWCVASKIEFDKQVKKDGRPCGVGKYEREKGYYLSDVPQLTIVTEWHRPKISTAPQGCATAVDRAQRRLKGDVPEEAFHRSSGRWSSRALVRAETALLRCQSWDEVLEITEELEVGDKRALWAVAWGDVKAHLDELKPCSELLAS